MSLFQAIDDITDEVALETLRTFHRPGTYFVGGNLGAMERIAISYLQRIGIEVTHDNLDAQLLAINQLAQGYFGLENLFEKKVSDAIS